jgi:septal ring factor EnvC (AmiA/AmiB activator)
MATNSQYLNRQLSDAQIEQLIQSLRGIKPVENDILDEEKTVNKEKMASYAEILKDDGKENENTNTKSNSSSEKVKPVFLKDEDVFGSSMKSAPL